MKRPNRLPLVLSIIVGLAATGFLAVGMFDPAQEVNSSPAPATVQPLRHGFASVSTTAPLEAFTPAASKEQTNFFLRAISVAQNESDPDRQSQLLSDLGDWLAAQGPDAAIELLNAYGSSSLVMDLETRFIREMAASDPQQAALTAMRLNDPGRQQALGGALVVWSEQKLDDAIAWVGELPEGTLKEGAQISLAYEAARTDPVKALALVSSQTSSPERDNVLFFAIAQWAASDPEAAATWAGQVGNVALKDQMIKTVATAWAETDPSSAATLALQSMPAGRNQEDAITSIVQRWTQTDPEAAANWVTQFPEGPLRNAATENLVKLWTDQNPDQAGSWLGTLPLTPSRDLAVLAYAQQVSPSQPAIAMQWAESISDAKLRLSAIGSLKTTR